MNKTSLQSLKSITKTAALFLSLVLNSIHSNALVNQYTFSQSNGVYTPLSNPTLIASATTSGSASSALNSVVFQLSFPGNFSFNFNGTDYTSCNVASNGFIAFGSVNFSTSVPISTSTAYAGVISAWGKGTSGIFDVAATTTSLNYQLDGNFPDRILTIEYKDMRPVSSSSVTNVVTMSYQIKLHETTNAVDIVYGPTMNRVNAPVMNSTVQIGLRGATNTDFNNRTNISTTLFSESVAGTLNTSVQNYSFNNTTVPAGMPSVGLTYTFIPPTNPLPVTLESFNGKTESNINILSWSTSNSQNFHHFELEKSLDGAIFHTITTIYIDGSNYHYNDEQTNTGKNIYRLKMVDNNGNFTYSQVVVLNVAGSQNTVIAFPNPVTNQATIQSNTNEKANIILTDITGKIIAEYNMLSNSLNIDMTGLPKGLYNIRYTAASIQKTMQIIKQ